MPDPSRLPIMQGMRESDLTALIELVDRVSAELDAALKQVHRTPMRTADAPTKHATSTRADAVQRAEAALVRLREGAKDERRRAADEGRKAAEWERNAVLAVRAKDDDLARNALVNRADHVRRQGQAEREADRLDRELEALQELLAFAREASRDPR